MASTMHPDAAGNFNQRGNALLARVRTRPHPGPPPRAFAPELHVSAHLGEGQIGEIRSAIIDGTGRELGRYFEEATLEAGLEGEDYRELQKLVESIQRTPAFRETISQERLLSAAMDWLRSSRQLSNVQPLCDYLVETCVPEIREYEIAIPIAMLSVQSPVPVGRAVIRPLTGDVLEDWFSGHRRSAQTEERRQAIEQYIARKLKELKGYSAAFVRIRAEEVRAREVALEEAENATALLRCCGPASITPRVTSCCVPLGKHLIPSFQAFSILNGKLDNATEGSYQRYWPQWALSNEDILRIRSFQLDALSEIYRNPQTALQRRIIDSVLLFSRVSIAHELADKLVLLFSSLESLFLRNATEPVQQSLADRLALMVGKDLAEKKEVVATTKSAYSLRSRFVHHAQEIADLELVERFMLFAWRGISGMVAKRNQFASLDELLDKIDERKLA